MITFPLYSLEKQEILVGEKSMNKLRQEIPFSVFVSIVLCFFIGCAGAHYGSIVPNAAATKAFEAFQTDPDMNYYYSGPEANPNALIGLKKSYALNSDLWKPIDPQPKVIKELITGMQNIAFVHGESQHGFIIRDNKGNTIGVWYSILRARTFIKMGEGNQVEILTPDLILFRTGDGADVESGK
jgi:hypothetical protein